MKIEIYTDGSCNNRTGRGGFAAIILVNGLEKQIITRSLGDATNNLMEMHAVIAGLEAIKPGRTVTVYTDSAYVMNAFEKGWIEHWKNDGWRKYGGRDLKNAEQWKKLHELVQERDVVWMKVKGHSGNFYNEKADKLARAAMMGITLKTDGAYPGEPIDDKQIARLWHAANKSGYQDEAIRVLLGEYGLVSTREITTSIYPEIIEKVRSKTIGKLYNRRVPQA